MSNAIEKIHEFERFGSVLGLERMSVLLEKLGNPQDELKVIHVAGTNGKGSICKYIYEVLQTGGYKTGLYTSPFIEVFNERIQFDGKLISDEDLAAFTDKVLAKSEEMVREGNESPTEFEVVTAIAFLYFKEKTADYVVLEVGLGGIGDSTNVVKNPLVSVIASISLDHTDRLGDTITAIAREKSGIIKANCPVVTTTDNPEALAVIRATADKLNAPLYETCDNSYEIIEETLEGCTFKTSVAGNTYELTIAMAGKHQVQNAIGALTALTYSGVEISGDALSKGFRLAKQVGRLEVMSREPYVIIDGAHNPDGSKALAGTINEFFRGKHVLMVVGILADKDISHVVDNFMKITDEFVITEPGNPRKMAAEELAEIITTKGGNCVIMKEPRDAVKYALSQEGYDLILFAGSLYLIGEIRGYIKNEY